MKAISSTLEPVLFIMLCKVELPFESMDAILMSDQLKWKLLRSTFVRCCLLCCTRWFQLLQSIYVTRDRVILKFEARVQIYVAVLNICCEIQSSGGNFVRFSKITSYEISFWLVLVKNMRSIRFLGVWWHYFAVNSRISETFSEKSSTFRWNVEYYKDESECSFQFRDLRSRVK